MSNIKWVSKEELRKLYPTGEDMSCVNYELNFAELVSRILKCGEERQTRNGLTKGIFGVQFKVDMSDGDYFPLLTGRKMFYKGVLGELAALLRGPQHVKDFEIFGCNYWKDWADKDGNLTLDYGNAWTDYNGFNQLEDVINKLKTDPTNRRIMLTSWRPDRLASLSLPCCHHTYQWYVRDGKFLDMIWMQRSVDTMIGLPSDVILAATWNMLIANEVGLLPGELTFQLGDTHIYAEHWEQAHKYVALVQLGRNPLPPRYKLDKPMWSDTTSFVPDDLEIINYNSLQAMKFELKA
jgi:thymidylate synthase